MACCVKAVTAPTATPVANNLSHVCDDDENDGIHITTE